MKIDPYYQRQKYRPMALFSGDIRFMRIFVELPWGGASEESGVVDNGNYQQFRWLFFGNFNMRPALYAEKAEVVFYL